MEKPVKKKIYNKLVKHAAKRAGYFCLIDPDRFDVNTTVDMAVNCAENGADALLIGGSLMIHDNFEKSLKMIRRAVDIPVLIFPGVFNFVSKHADALLLLSMVSSRNPQMLIGEQVRAAPLIRSCNLEVIGTGYMVIDSGKLTSVQYMSHSIPIPRNKPDIAVAHALAAQYLGMRLIYMDAGSGADQPMTVEMIGAVRDAVEVPIIVGGGIRTPEAAIELAKAGADFIVTGTVIEDEKDFSLVRQFADAIHGITR